MRAVVSDDGTSIRLTIYDPASHEATAVAPMSVMAALNLARRLIEAATRHLPGDGEDEHFRRRSD